MSDLYGPNEALPKTKVEGGDSFNSPGDYTSCIGRTYANTNKKTGRKLITTDFFLLNRTSKDGSMNFEMMKIAVKEGKQVLDFIYKDKENKVPRIDGILFRVNFPDPLPTDSDAAKNFFSMTKKRITRAFEAFDEATSMVDWQKIQGLAGRLCSMTLVESKDFVNVDPKSIQLYATGKIEIDNLKHIYEVIESEFMKRRAAREQSAPTSATPPPTDASVPPPSSDDPLPF
jgi:hypothetical protein